MGWRVTVGVGRRGHEWAWVGGGVTSGHGWGGGGRGIVTVRDAGPASPDNGGQPAQLFRSNVADGAGLGLSIAQWVAQLHGGTLRLERTRRRYGRHPDPARPAPGPWLTRPDP